MATPSPQPPKTKKARAQTPLRRVTFFQSEGEEEDTGLDASLLQPILEDFTLVVAAT